MPTESPGDGTPDALLEDLADVLASVIRSLGHVQLALRDLASGSPSQCSRELRLVEKPPAVTDDRT
jgi:hypothetical protein